MVEDKTVSQSGSEYGEEVEESASWRQHLPIALRLLVAAIFLCSLAYPAVVSVMGRLVWSANAQGSIVTFDGTPVGSELIGQQFSLDDYFHPRPSSTGYDATNSGSQNLGPLNEALTMRVRKRLEELQARGIDPAHVPVNWVTESGSALDPHITPAAARLQIPRVSQATGLAPTILKKLIETNTEGAFAGLFGRERVNVLLLNLDIQERLGEQR